jgi:hypothetical protein
MKEALKALMAVTCLLGGAALIVGGLLAAAFDIMYMAWGSVVGSGGGELLRIGLLAVLVGSLPCWVGWRMLRGAKK